MLGIWLVAFILFAVILGTAGYKEFFNWKALSPKRERQLEDVGIVGAFIAALWGAL